MIPCLAASLALALAAGPPPARPLVPYAPVKETAAALPSAFLAPLPHVKDLRDVDWIFGWGRDPRFVPSAHARDLPCEGDRGLWRRARAALVASVREGATWEAIHDTWGAFLVRCEDGCGAVPQVEPALGAAGLPAWLVAARCLGPEARALFARPDVPAAAVLARDEAVRYRAPADRPAPGRLAAAGLEVVRSRVASGRRGAALDVVATGDAGAIAALVTMARDDPDEDRRRELRRVLCDARLPLVYRGLEALGCPGRSEPGEPAPEDRPLPADPGVVDLADRLRHRNVDEVIDGTPAPHRGRLLDALEACARDGEGAPYERPWRERCLRGLARLDRPRAVVLAAALPPPRHSGMRELTTALTRYPSSGALEARLRALGLIPAGRRTQGITPRELLESAGALDHLPWEGLGTPPAHDRLLRRLWRLGGRPSGEAFFEELPPQGQGDEQPWRLVAWVDGRRFEADAEAHGETYDLDAAVGLVNAVERRLGRARRLALFGDVMDGPVALAGPETGLRAAFSEGLLAETPDLLSEGAPPGGIRLLPDQ